MGGRRSMFLPRFVRGRSNEELIVEIFGNATLSSVKNSFISWSSRAPVYSSLPRSRFFVCVFSLCVE